MKLTAEKGSMRDRYQLPITALASALGLVSLAALSLSAQSPANSGKPTPAKSAGAGKAAKAATSARTVWGDPDIQGVWFVAADIPLERSAANANKEFLTDAEMAEADLKKGLNPGRNARSANTNADVNGAYNAVFNSVLKTGRRTSMIIDPPDGRIPPLVAGAQGPRGRGAAGGGRGGAFGVEANPGVADNPETAGQIPGGSSMVRCLGVAMPFLPLNTLFGQGTVMQVVQSPKSLGIYMEDDHDGGGNRVILLDGRPHPPASSRFYLGDSRGHWEGNTLVVETTNFLPGSLQPNLRTVTSEMLKMTERITRVDATNLKREITIEDPRTWTRPWTVVVEMSKTDDSRQMIFDSACHEGNYGLIGILAGARKAEQAPKK
jgi:hypothetical protein